MTDADAFQAGLWIAAWAAAFLLGKQLSAGLTRRTARIVVREGERTEVHQNGGRPTP